MIINKINLLNSANPFLAMLFLSSSVSAGVVINEIFPNPVGADSVYEWVEIYNNGQLAVDISNWTIEAANTAWDTKFVVPSTTIIDPGAFLVIGDEFVGSADLLMPQGSTLGLGNAAASGDAVRIINNSGTVIDTIVYGPNNNDGFIDDTGGIAFSLAPVGAAGESIARMTDGQDTDDSAQDFIVQAPTIGLPNSKADPIFEDGFENP